MEVGEIRTIKHTFLVTFLHTDVLRDLRTVINGLVFFLHTRQLSFLCASIPQLH